MINPKRIQNIYILLFLLFSSTAYGQSCMTEVLEDDLQNPSLIITCDFNGDKRKTLCL